jgi:hypothetical protein
VFPACKKNKRASGFFPEALKKTQKPRVAYLVHPGLYSSQLFNKALHRMNAPKKEEASKIKYKLGCHALDHAVFRSKCLFRTDDRFLSTVLFHACQQKNVFSGQASCFTTKDTKSTKKSFVVFKKAPPCNAIRFNIFRPEMTPSRIAQINNLLSKGIVII